MNSLLRLLLWAVAALVFPSCATTGGGDAPAAGDGFSANLRCCGNG